MLRKNQSDLNLTPIHGSAPKTPENLFSWFISFSVRYLLLALTVLHSIASFLILFPARTSGHGKGLLPEPATLIADHPFPE